MDADAWDERYAASELVWSAAPNRFVEAECADLPPGRAVDLAAGEGRNAIWLAGRGWRVTAVDFSRVALEKAARVVAGSEAADRVEWVCADATTWTGEGYDLAVVPRAWAHVAAVVAGIGLDPATPTPPGWRAHFLRVVGREAPSTMGDGVTAAFRPFHGGHDPADAVDRAIMAARNAAFPGLGLDPLTA